MTRFLWNSYNFMPIPVSKTYGPDGTSLRCSLGAARDHQPIATCHSGSNKDCASDKRNRNKESPMMDILMLALALVFFAAAIGYSYVCERL